MNRGTLIEAQLIYWITLIIFFVGMLAVVQRVSSETSDWEGLYAFQLAQFIERLGPGDEVRLDVTSVVVRAQQSGVEGVLQNTLRFSGQAVGVQLSPGSWHWYRWYTPVVIENATIVPEGDQMILTFRVVGR